MDAILWYEPVRKVLQAAVTATTANGETLALEGKYASVALQVAGTMTNASIHFEGSIDGTNWVSLVGVKSADGTTMSATGANAGIWTVPVVGISFFRARKSGTGTSAITVTAVATAAPTVQVT